MNTETILIQNALRANRTTYHPDVKTVVIEFIDPESNQVFVIPVTERSAVYLRDALNDTAQKYLQHIPGGDLVLHPKKGTN